ncbi:DNA polymerase-3 subunit epsilon [Algoriphagus alkaliphilus]|jgi:DNA polymerase-3 subunit epsilon|uniref:DNA polymerase-3 subunit epsilon n=1 Tax=Algoriphagus alkaliphilus TaxID=279824 RepID=A0A1G5XTP0_9BACT|nr:MULTISPECIES: 3'-5' exonuclease [Algoriphagus]MBA4299101.1 3'-5' exonuclease [Cyclobacterium sp.]MDO8967872.1 3'-5' exonuclease [Algoriphagus sp.]MDP2041275.1 3'-5' exonuclease [Algoriphagus sp.]MDP3201161.1 3'-5' exonuclease [Algoriphagus sp.]MDP3470978.1 3'-5' exonuclease [Algoriphagus sp.]
MKLNLRNSIAFFDLEATGTNVGTDRIVEISIVKLHPDQGREIYTKRVNPGIPIPLEASLIHGIYDKDIKDEPTFRDIAKEIQAFIGKSDLGGFNVLKYDIPLLVEEFLRSGIDFDLENRNLLDAQKIFFMMEKRNLTAAYKFYCGRNLENAHSAEADTLATLDVFQAQVERYQGEEMEDLQGNKVGIFQNDMKKIHEMVNEKMVDLAGRFVFNSQGQEIFNFGKHKGKTIDQALKEEPGYYDWMMKGDFPLDTKRKLTQVKLRGFGSK